MRKELPLLLTSLFGLLVVFSKFFHIGQVWAIDQVVEQWILISQGFAVAVGVINLTRLHGKNVMRQRPDWFYSAVLLISMFFYMGLTIATTVEGDTSRWLYDNFITPTGSALFGMIAFYITSASYRVFRVRSREATLMMIAAIIVMLGNAPIGDVMISGWGRATAWMMDFPVSAVFRGIRVASYIGALAVAMRIVLGLERAHMGGYGAGG